MSFFSRVFLAWSAYFRILFDAAFAERVAAVGEVKALPESAPEKAARPEPEKSAQVRMPRGREALQLLGLLQRGGRFIDFVEQDIATFSDADVGVAARVVHEGCRKAIRTHFTIAAIRTEEEGANVTIDAVTPAVSLIGNVAGSAPFCGKLEHRGWRASRVELPDMSDDHDANVLAPAEVSL